jgi:hypothetical protein
MEGSYPFRTKLEDAMITLEGRSGYFGQMPCSKILVLPQVGVLDMQGYHWHRSDASTRHLLCFRLFA